MATAVKAETPRILRDTTVSKLARREKFAAAVTRLPARHHIGSASQCRPSTSRTNTRTEPRAEALALSKDCSASAGELTDCRSTLSSTDPATIPRSQPTLISPHVLH